MRPVEQKPAVAGAVGTILVWILIFLFFYLGAVLFAPKPFKTIKIRLDAPTKSEKQVKKVEQNSAKTQKSEAKETPKGEDSPHASSKESAPLSPKEQSSLKSSETPAQAKQDVKKTESKPASKKQAESGKRKTENSKPDATKTAKSQSKKTEPKKSEPAKSAPKQTKQAPSKTIEKPKMAEQTLAPDLTNGGSFTSKKEPAKEKFDWSQFDDMEGNSSSSNSTGIEKNTTHATERSAFSGSAALSSSQNPTPVSSASKSKSASGEKPSSLTTKALAGVVSAHKYSSTSGGVSSSVTANTGSSSDGKVSIAMSDGTPRILLEPAEPKIILSKEAAAMIDSTKRLTVSFTVSASGNVPVTSVKISPDILPSLVSMEIREQISKWRFASAPNDGLARFDYTIQKN
jgi:hypothetical protein